MRWQLGDLGEGGESCGVSGAGVEDCVLYGIEGGSVVFGEADADGVGAAVDDHGIVGGETVEDGGGVFGHFGGGEAEAGGDDGIDLEAGGGTADGVVNAVLGIDDAGDFADGGLDLGAEVVEESLVVGEELDLDGLG